MPWLDSLGVNSGLLRSPVTSPVLARGLGAAASQGTLWWGRLAPAPEPCGEVTGALLNPPESLACVGTAVCPVPVPAAGRGLALEAGGRGTGLAGGPAAKASSWMQPSTGGHVPAKKKTVGWFLRKKDSKTRCMFFLKWKPVFYPWGFTNFGQN